jgi:hypothetical protein
MIWVGGFGSPPILLQGGVMPKKVEEIVSALERDHPGWSKSKVYAIANAAYNKMKKRG